MSDIETSLRIWTLVRDELVLELADARSLSIKQRTHLLDELEMCEEQVRLYKREAKAEVNA